MQKQPWGRGIGSRRGKTVGRGYNGQKSRSGGGAGPNLGFEGGQTTIWKSVRKFGFTNAEFKGQFEYVNMTKILEWKQKGRLGDRGTSAEKPLTLKDMVEARLIRKVSSHENVRGVRLLARGAHLIDFPLHVECAAASKETINKIVKAGGSVTVLYFNPLGVRANAAPHKFYGKRLLPKAANPPLNMKNRVNMLYSPEFPEGKEFTPRLPLPILTPEEIAKKYPNNVFRSAYLKYE